MIKWPDDHSGYLLSLHVHPCMPGEIGIDTFIQNIDHYGLPASTLTYNGGVYRSRFYLRPKRFRIPLVVARCSLEERFSRSPPNPGENRTHLPNSETMAGNQTTRTCNTSSWNSSKPPTPKDATGP